MYHVFSTQSLKILLQQRFPKFGSWSIGANWRWVIKHFNFEFILHLSPSSFKSSKISLFKNKNMYESLVISVQVTRKNMGTTVLQHTHCWWFFHIQMCERRGISCSEITRNFPRDQTTCLQANNISDYVLRGTINL